METITMLVIGYVIWCCLAFAIARFLDIRGLNNKAMSLAVILSAAPLVLIDYLTGKGLFR